MSSRSISGRVGVQAAMALDLGMVPAPRQLTVREGEFTLGRTTAVQIEEGLERVGTMLRGYLAPIIDEGNGWRSVGESEVTRIELRTGGNLPPSGYLLDIDPRRLTITGSDEVGVFYGIQTVRQLLPVRSLRRIRPRESRWSVPCVQVQDWPRFGWRGFLLDVSRHFFGRDEVLRIIELLALHRMNVLQLHLTDDQGWRLEILRYPALTEVGSWRSRSMLGEAEEDRSPETRYDGIPHSGFFTQDDVREIVEHATRHFITVVPEIDVPGHSQAAIAAYPWLGNHDPAEPVEVWTDWGVNPRVLNVTDSTLEFYRNVLTEVLELFPGPFVHLGGDECPKDEWMASASAQERIRTLGLTDEDGLQAWFIGQLAQFLQNQGRRPVGWDEILEGGLPAGTTVTSWRGEEGGIAAARLGHDVVMAPDPWLYLYHHQSDRRDLEPPGCPPVVDLRTIYEYDPLPPALTGTEQRRILGAQCQMWTEYVASPRQLEQMVLPRLSAFAESVWLHTGKDFEDFTRRLPRHIERLRALDFDSFSYPVEDGAIPQTDRGGE